GSTPSSLFCSLVFKQQRLALRGLWRGQLACYPIQAAQGRLRCTQHSGGRVLLRIAYRFIPCRSSSTSGRRIASAPGAAPHAHGSPRRRGQRLHALVDRPTALTPSSNPRLGVDGHHQGLHRCARDGFLGPSSTAWSLTRILHHLSFW